MNLQRVNFGKGEFERVNLKKGEFLFKRVIFFQKGEFAKGEFCKG